ncbi:MAG: Jag N-terminal domain-containing protein [Firmicutes bacterium]|nr:Jag N-terminal domain-containing protein [Bacillota bacterium]
MRKEYEASAKTVEEAIDKACILAGTTIENVEVEVLEFGGRGIFGIGHKDARVRVILETEDKPAPPPKKANPQPKENAAKDKKESDGGKGEGKNGERRAAGQNKARNNKNNGESRREERVRPPKENRESKEEKTESVHADAHITPVLDGAMAGELTAAAMDFLTPIFQSLQCQPQVQTQIKEGILWLCLEGGNLGLLIGRRGETLNALQYLTNLAVNRHRSDHVRLVLDVENYRSSREETLIALAHKMADKAVRTGRRVEFEPMTPHERRIVHLALQNDKRVDTSSRGEEPYRRVVIYRRRNDKRRNGGKPAAAQEAPVRNEDSSAGLE